MLCALYVDGCVGSRATAPVYLSEMARVGECRLDQRNQPFKTYGVWKSQQANAKYKTNLVRTPDLPLQGLHIYSSAGLVSTLVCVLGLTSNWVSCSTTRLGAQVLGVSFTLHVCGTAGSGRPAAEWTEKGYR